MFSVGSLQCRESMDPPKSPKANEESIQEPMEIEKPDDDTMDVDCTNPQSSSDALMSLTCISDICQKPVVIEDDTLAAANGTYNLACSKECYDQWKANNILIEKQIRI